MVDVMPINPPVAITTSNDEVFLLAIQLGGFILFILIILGVLFLYESRGNRLFWRGKDGRMRKKRFTEKDVTPEGFVNVSKEEAIQLSKDIAPVMLKNFFGGINPTYFGDSKYPMTLTFAYPSTEAKYPTPALVKEGINNLIMKELQTYHEKTSTTSSMIMVVLAGLTGLFGGFFIATSGLLG
jgi:hypothetical protein